MTRMIWGLIFGIMLQSCVSVPTHSEDDEVDAASSDVVIVSSCGPEQELCGEECASTARDSRHCGGCNHRCEEGELCVEGACVFSCPAELTDCSGSCRDLRTDRANCGACGEACEAGQLCTNSNCVTSCATVDCSEYDRACSRSACVVLEGRARCVPQTVGNGLSCDEFTNGCSTGATCSGGRCLAAEISSGEGQCSFSDVEMRGRGTTPARGWSANNFWMHEEGCPAEHVLVGLRVMYGTPAFSSSAVTRLRGVCGRLVRVDDEFIVLSGPELPLGGTAGSSEVELSSMCPENQIVVGFGGRSMSEGLAALGVHCAPLAVTRGDTIRVALGAVEEQAPVGGADGSSFEAARCANGEFAKGQQVWSPPGAYQRGVALRCASADLILGN